MIAILTNNITITSLSLKCTSLGLCNLMIAAILAKMYSETKNTYCKTAIQVNGKFKSFSGIDAAKVGCSEDDNCVGILDNCGKGTNFKLCHGPMTMVPSGCGSIIYQKRGK